MQSFLILDFFLRLSSQALCFVCKERMFTGNSLDLIFHRHMQQFLNFVHWSGPLRLYNGQAQNRLCSRIISLSSKIVVTECNNRCDRIHFLLSYCLKSTIICAKIIFPSCRLSRQRPFSLRRLREKKKKKKRRHEPP